MPEYTQAEDAIEKASRSLKTDNGHIPYEEPQGIYHLRYTLCLFPILIVRSAPLRGMESSGLLKKYSLFGDDPGAGEYPRDEDQDRYLRELERTKKQKDMSDALERILWWQKQGVLVNMVGN